MQHVILDVILNHLWGDLWNLKTYRLVTCIMFPVFGNFTMVIYDVLGEEIRKFSVLLLQVKLF